MPRLGRFNVFIGETDAIDSFPEAAIKTGDCGIWDTENIQDYNIVDAVSNVETKYERGILGDALKTFGIVIKTKNEIEIRDTIQGLSKSSRLITFWLAYTISGFPEVPVCFKEFGRHCDPKIGKRLTQELATIAKELNRTILLSTFNVGCLDGLDLADNEQRLFVASYNQEENPIAHRVEKPKPLDGQEPIDLSEAYIRGYLGGLHSRNF